MSNFVYDSAKQYRTHCHLTIFFFLLVSQVLIRLFLDLEPSDDPDDIPMIVLKIFESKTNIIDR